MKIATPASQWMLVATTIVFVIAARSQDPQQTPRDSLPAAKNYLTKNDYDELTRRAGRLKPEDVPALKKRADEGDLNSQLLMGRLYHFGCGLVQRDPKSALEWYRKAADQDSSIAEVEIGTYYRAPGNDKAEALRWYRRAAERRDSIAERNLGRLLAETAAASKSFDAATWLRRAAEHGDDLAVEDLMKLYNDGTANPEKNLEENRRQGVLLLQSWANQGNAPAQTELALAYSMGSLGLKKDAVQAFQWMTKAAEKSPEAEAFLGQFYSTGIGTEANREEAVRWYRKSAEHGHWRGQLNLAYGYEHGHGVAKDPVEALKWFRAAADQEFPQAEYQLAEMYDRGHGVPKDKSTAMMWYILASQAATENSMSVLPPNGFSFYRHHNEKEFKEAERRAKELKDRHDCR